MMEAIAGWLIGGWVIGGLVASIKLRLLNRKAIKHSTREKHKREQLWIRVLNLANLSAFMGAGLLALSLVLDLLRDWKPF